MRNDDTRTDPPSPVPSSEFRAPSSLPPLFVLSGPAGAGKNTVVDAVLKACRFPLRRAVTATTRDPRPGEQAGVDYHFWPRERFEQAIASETELIEYAVVHGHDYYGTPRTEVDGARLSGSGVLLVIDVQGAAAVRRLYPDDHRSVFLDVPSVGELERRLRARNTESEERIARRLATAEQEMARAGEFDVRVVNDTVPNATARLLELIDHEFTQRGFSPCSTS